MKYIRPGLIKTFMVALLGAACIVTSVNGYAERVRDLASIQGVRENQLMVAATKPRKRHSRFKAY
jgi:hypothetical protein